MEALLRMFVSAYLLLCILFVPAGSLYFLIRLLSRKPREWPDSIWQLMKEVAFVLMGVVVIILVWAMIYYAGGA